MRMRTTVPEVVFELVLKMLLLTDVVEDEGGDDEVDVVLPGVLVVGILEVVLDGVGGTVRVVLDVDDTRISRLTLRLARIRLYRLDT